MISLMIFSCSMVYVYLFFPSSMRTEAGGDNSAALLDDVKYALIYRHFFKKKKTMIICVKRVVLEMLTNRKGKSY